MHKDVVHNTFNTYGNLAMVLSMIAAVTGIGTSGSTAAVTIMYVIKKAKAKAVTF